MNDRKSRQQKCSAILALILVILAGCGSEAPPSEEEIFKDDVLETPNEPASGAKEGYAALPPSAYRAEWRSSVIPRQVRPGAEFPVEVSVANAGDAVWPDPATSGGTPPAAGSVRLGYRWRSASGPEPAPSRGYSNARSDLQTPVAPGGVADFRMEVKAPTDPGTYELELDLVQEMVAWFSTRGSQPLIVDVVVR